MEKHDRTFKASAPKVKYAKIIGLLTLTERKTYIKG
jgi:hypothetical protein